MKIAFAGFRHGHILALYEAAVKACDVEIVGCLEEDEKARKAAEDAYKIEFNYSDYQSLLSDTSASVVAIGDYYGKRGQMVIAALEAGKHVICDKPICTSLDELSRIESLAKERGLVVGCMLDLRFMKTAQKARELVRGGEIGKLLNASFTGQHCLDYGNRPSWYFEEGKHGGTINDIAIHGIDIVRFVSGKDLTKVSYAETKNGFATMEPNFKDMGHFVAEFDDLTLMADVSYSAPKFDGILPTYWRFCFWGTEGLISFNYADDELHIYKKTETIIKCGNEAPDHLHELMRQIKGDASLMMTDDVLNSQRQTLMIQEVADREK